MKFTLILAIILLLIIAFSPNGEAVSGTRAVGSTAYCPSEPGQTIGNHDNRLRPGKDVAMRLPVGTLVYVTKSPTGRHYWRVNDTPDAYTNLDFHVSCSSMNRWGRRTVGYKVVKP